MFTDAKGRAWDLRIPFSERAFLRERGLDLANPPECLGQIDRLLLEAPEKIVEAAYKLASGQRNTVDPEEFARGIVGGECLYNLARALAAAVCDFFPYPSGRKQLLDALAGNLSPPNPQPPWTSTESSGRPPEPPEPPTPAPTPSES